MTIRGKSAIFAQIGLAGEKQDRGAEAGRCQVRAPPSRIGHYRIVEALAEGGMSVVYRGLDLRTGNAVAVKTVRRHHARRLRSLRQEILSLAGMRHPGIVPILEHGVHEGLPWYSMPMLEGLTLDSYVVRAWEDLCAAEAAEGTGPQDAAVLTSASVESLDPKNSGSPRKLPGKDQTADWNDPQQFDETVDTSSTQELKARSKVTGEDLTLPQFPGAKGKKLAKAVLDPRIRRMALELIQNLCHPLAYLHGAGLVHRDLKPENILVLSGGRPVLLDFGLMSRFSGHQGRDVLEAGGHRVGTVHYMSPEQIRGEMCDARSDLYSMGCILYEFVTGRRPFEASTAEGILEGHLHAHLRSPSHYVKELPPELEKLILGLLEKNPRARLGYADVVERVLAGLLGEERQGCTIYGPLPKARPYLYRPRFCGRQRELDFFQSRWKALQHGRGGLTLLLAEDGGGKTRFLGEVGSLARRRKCRVLMGESRPELGSAAAFAPLQQPMQSIADRCREWGEEETKLILGRRGAVLAGYFPAFVGLGAHSEEPDELPPEAALVRLYSCLAETLGALTASKPVVLALDDLHWADELTLGFLKFLANGKFLSDVPLLIVGAARSEEGDGALASLLASRGIDFLRLEPLGIEGVGAIVRDMLAMKKPPLEFVRTLAFEAGGKPAFVAEYLRMAVAEGILTRDGSGRWSVGKKWSPSVAPEGVSGDERQFLLLRSLRDYTLRRFQELSPQATRFIEAAAVLGGKTSLDILTGVVGTEEEALEAVVELQRAEIMEVVDDLELRFVHERLRQVVLEGLQSQRRRELHRKAAEAIEGHGSGEQQDASGNLAVRLGYHWECAGDMVRAKNSYLSGARWARKRYAHGLAEELYRAFLRLGNGRSKDSVEARLELCSEVLRIQGRVSEALPELELCLAEARELGFRAGEARVLVELGIVQQAVARLEQALETYEASLAIYREIGDRRGEAIALGKLANVYGIQARLSEALANHHRSLEIFRELGDLRYEGAALANLASFHYDRGENHRALELFQRAVEIHREVGNRFHEGITLGNLATLLFEEGEHARALDLYEKARVIYREVGDLAGDAYAACTLGNWCLKLGRLEESRRAFQRSLSIVREIGDRSLELVNLVQMALLARQGEADLPRANELLNKAESMLADFGDLKYLALCHVQRGHLALAEGRSAHAFLAEVQSFHVMAPEGPGSDISRAIHRLERAQAAFEAGEPLFMGECPEELPQGLRRQLIEDDLLPPTSPNSQRRS